MSSCHTRSLLLAALLACGAQLHAAPAAQHGAASVQLWHAAARDAIARTRPNQQAALRLLAYLSLAQHEAAQALRGVPAATSEAAWSAAFDAASAELLSAIVPGERTAWQVLANTLAGAREADEGIAAAHAVGVDAARRVIARASTDGFDAAWTGTAPDDGVHWKSQLQPPRPPHLPQLGSAKTVFLPAAPDVAVAVPPQPGSEPFRRALAEVRTRNAAPEGLARAKRWEMTGGSLVAGFWDETATQLARREGLGGDATARVLALTLGATYDANIVCHRIKYTYWVARPSQADPSIQPRVGLPNHPSYPSNHSCDSTAAAAVLARFFPKEERALAAMAREAGESRIDGGIHYRFDVEAGEAIGRSAAGAALGDALQ